MAHYVRGRRCQGGHVSHIIRSPCIVYIAANTHSLAINDATTVIPLPSRRGVAYL